MTNICKDCGDKVFFSAVDKCYVEEFGTCWNCDKKKWEAGTLPLEIFEERENVALRIATKKITKTQKKKLFVI